MVEIDDNKPIDKPSPRQSMTIEELIQVLQSLEEQAATATDQAVARSQPSPTQNPSPDPSASASRSQTSTPPPSGAALPGLNDEHCDKLKDFLIFAFYVAATYGILILIFYLVIQS